MLVAIADLAILTAATGVVTMLLIITGLVLIAGGVAAARQLTKRDVPAREAVARRRA